MKIIQIGIEDSKITEISSKLGVLSAVCEVGSKNKTQNEKYSLNFYDSLEDLINFEDFQAVILNVSESDAPQIIKKLLYSKKHVFVSKITMDPSQISEIEEIAIKNKINFIFGFEQRFNPVIQSLKDIKVGNKYGELLMLEFYREGLSFNKNEMLFDLMKNEIDLANFIFGDWPIVVFARFGNFNSEKENFASIMIGYKNNKTALILSNGLSSKNVSNLRAIYSEDVVHSDLLSYETKLKEDSIKLPKNNSLEQQIQYFIDVMGEDTKTHELSNTIKIAEAALLSSKQGVPIYLDLK